MQYTSPRCNNFKIRDRRSRAFVPVKKCSRPPVPLNRLTASFPFIPLLIQVEKFCILCYFHVLLWPCIVFSYISLFAFILIPVLIFFRHVVSLLYTISDLVYPSFLLFISGESYRIFLSFGIMRT